MYGFASAAPAPRRVPVAPPRYVPPEADYYVQLPETLAATLTRAERETYRALLTVARGNPTVQVGQRALAEQAQYSERMVRDALHALEARGLFTRLDPGWGQDTIYTLTPIPLRGQRAPAARPAAIAGRQRHSLPDDSGTGCPTPAAAVAAPSIYIDPTEDHIEDHPVSSEKEGEREGPQGVTAPELAPITPNAEPATPNSEPYSPYIAGIILDHSAELGDTAHATINATRGLQLWGKSGLSEEEFVQLLHDARAATRRQQGKIGGCGPNKIAFYFGQVATRRAT